MMDSERLKRLRDLGDDEAAREHRRQRERLGIGPTSRCVDAAEVWCGYELRASVSELLDLCKESSLPWCFPGWRGTPSYAWSCLFTSISARIPAIHGGPVYSTPDMRRLAITSGAVRCETLLGTLATRVGLPDLDEDDPVGEFSVRLLKASRRNMEEGDV